MRRSSPEWLATKSSVSSRRRVVELAPRASGGVVHVATWIWADPGAWHDVSATASLPTLAATVTATPTRIRFDPGDGAYGAGPVDCNGPGAAWEASSGDDAASSCSYTYRHSSSLSPSGLWTAKVAFTWHAVFTASDGTTADLGTLTTTAELPVTVHELEAVLR